MDFGNEAVLRISHLRQMQQQFEDLPFQVCSLNFVLCIPTEKNLHSGANPPSTPETRETVSDQVGIGFGFESDWLIGWTNHKTKEAKTKAISEYF